MAILNTIVILSTLLAIGDAAALVPRRAQTAGCYPSQFTAKYEDVKACKERLEKLGTAACAVAASGTQLCQSGSVFVTGYAERRATSSSYCGDVAKAVQTIIDTCTGDSGKHLILHTIVLRLS